MGKIELIVNNMEQKTLKKTVKVDKEIEINNALLTVYQNSFGELTEFKGLDKDDNEKLRDYSKVNEDKVKDNVISNIITNFEMKDELYEVEKMTIQALEVIVKSQYQIK